jgi:hypothetical protein
MADTKTLLLDQLLEFKQDAFLMAKVLSCIEESGRKP